ncbi:MAG: glycosyltransferase family 2 protein, partial [Halobacteriota archaeon]
THGVLISNRVIDAIGYYDSCHFFTGLEDYDYANRALRAKFVVLLIGTAEVQHPDHRRKRAISDQKKRAEVHKLRPVHLGIVPNVAQVSFARNKRRSLALFSQFYYFTTSLTRWQFTVAFIYSLCDNLLSKFTKTNELCLRKTLNTYVKCFTSNIRREWHLGCVEEFCQLILD